MTVDIFTGVRVSLAIQMVDLSGPPSAADSLHFERVELPGRHAHGFRPCYVKLRQLHLLLLHIEIAKGRAVAVGEREAAYRETGAGAVGEQRTIQIH